MFPRSGILEIDNNSPLIGRLIFINNDTETRTELFAPSEHDVWNMCLEHEVNFHRVMEYLLKKDSYVHTMMIDVQLFNEAHSTSERR